MSRQNHPSKFNFIFVQGVLGWGVGVALAWSVAMGMSSGEGIGEYLPSALIGFPIGGALFGYFRYRIARGNQVRHLRDADEIRESIQSDEFGCDFQVGMLPMKALGWVGILFFSTGFIGSVVIGEYATGLVFLPIIGFFVFILLVTGTITLNETKIRYLCPVGNFEIRWDEVEFVEVDAQRQEYVLSSDTKRLPIQSPGLWSGNEKRAAREFFFMQIEKHAYPERISQLALIRLPKNVRVRR